MAQYRRESWLREQYMAEGRGATSIAKECGVDTNTIYKWMDRFGIDTRSVSEAAKLAMTDERRKALSEMFSGDGNPMHGRTGESSPVYSGGYDGGWRQGKRWQQTRSDVYERAGNVCEECGGHGQLHAHHKTPVSDGGNKHDMDNLICLCELCHEKAHYGGS